MSRQLGLQRLVAEQRNARLRSSALPESVPFSRYISRAIIQARLLRKWLSGSQRLKELMSHQEISSRFRLTEREVFLVVVLLYILSLHIVIGR